MDLERIGRIFEEDLNFINKKENLLLNPDVIRYISLIMLNYTKNIPLYIIDIKENSTYKTFKTKGDVSLLLVGLFTEWLNRTNRPLTENNYIQTGKQNYENAYFYLDLNYGKELRAEIGKEYVNYLKNQKDIINTYLEIFKEISEYFEGYAYLLKKFRHEKEQNSEFFNQIPAGRLIELENLLFKIFNS